MAQAALGILWYIIIGMMANLITGFAVLFAAYKTDEKRKGTSRENEAANTLIGLNEEIDLGVWNVIIGVAIWPFNVVGNIVICREILRSQK